MGMQDRDWWKEAQKERTRKESRSNNTALPASLKRGSAAIAVFWLVVMGLLYAGMAHYLKPRAVSISASGDLVIPRARDGHFYAAGLVNGKPVNFMVDTGASLVTVSEKFSRTADISAGVPTVFKTANGDFRGRIVSDVPVALGPVSISSVRIGVGLVGDNANDALLGQSFLSKFEIVLSKEQMILRQR
ncbi:TIGR02281 family clan AA aspartic protease [Polaromonas hydrogenivorans]